MDKYRIRTSETDSVKGLASRQKLDVSLTQTTKQLPYPNVSSVLSQRSVYEQERKEGNKFRLILTIVPYCTNVLFNALTEIVKNEGSDDVEVVTDKNKAKASTNILGRVLPDRIHMISNTEYSSELHGGYTYHPGYDFFDNHILRNKSFKLVMPTKEKNKVEFNTLEDFARDRNGEKIDFTKRVSVSETNTGKKHLYMIDDILSIDDSINNNLYEENGWWGFVNNTTVEAKEYKDKKWKTLDISRALNNYRSCEFIDMYPDRSLFSFTPKYNKFTHEHENNWNVVLTYPYRNMYNHPICLGGSSYIKRTHNDDGKIEDEAVSEGGRWMGLKVLSVQLGSGKLGSNTLMFRTYTKHGLKQGDTFYVYYTNPYKEESNYSACGKFGDATLNGSEVFYESETYYRVTNNADANNSNGDFFFYTHDLSVLTDIYNSYLRFVEREIKKGIATEDIPLYEAYTKDNKKGVYDSDGKLKTDLVNLLLRYANFRIRRCVSGVKSTYYLRQFRKIPNLRAAQREMTKEESNHTSKFNGAFDNFIKENALDPKNPKHQRLFNNETYQLGFAANIYNDNITQITFTDGIDVKGLTDNLGRPLSELYYTIVKNNAGFKAWYDGVYAIKTNEQRKKYGNDYTIEFSHCFGRITSGLETLVLKDDTENTTAPIDYWKKLSSIMHISNVINNSNDTSTNVDEDKISKLLDSDISYKDDFFYGDLVEYNSFEAKENIITKVMHRFNTAQRETTNNKMYSQYQFHEITSDDYDKDSFKVTEYSAVGNINEDPSDRSIDDFATITRPEGYYYQPHHKIQIREFTSIRQGGDKSILVKSVRPIQRNGILIQVTTKLPHGVNENDTVMICDETNDKRYITKCCGVINRTTFLMSPQYSEIINNYNDFEDKTIEQIDNTNRYNWIELCEILNGEHKDDLHYPELKLRLKNKDIPMYASYIGSNRYLWRDAINIGDSRSEELEDFVFANGYFYITQSVNFYLKRQDPFGNSGLYFDGSIAFPNDPSGQPITTDVDEGLTKETEPKC